MAIRPARIGIGTQLDANGNGTITVKPYAAFWSSLTITLKASALSGPIFDITVGTDPVLFGSGQRVDLGPLLVGPDEQVLIKIVNGAPGDTIAGTLWGVQADTEIEAAGAFSGSGGSAFSPPPRLLLGIYRVAGDGAQHSSPPFTLPNNAIGLVVVLDSIAQGITTSMTMTADQTATLFGQYRSGGLYCFSCESGAGQGHVGSADTLDSAAILNVNTSLGGPQQGRFYVFAIFRDMPAPAGLSTTASPIAGNVPFTAIAGFTGFLSSLQMSANNVTGAGQIGMNVDGVQSWSQDLANGITILPPIPFGRLPIASSVQFTQIGGPTTFLRGTLVLTN